MRKRRDLSDPIPDMAGRAVLKRAASVGGGHRGQWPLRHRIVSRQVRPFGRAGGATRGNGTQKAHGACLPIYIPLDRSRRSRRNPNVRPHPCAENGAPRSTGECENAFFCWGRPALAIDRTRQLADGRTRRMVRVRAPACKGAARRLVTHSRWVAPTNQSTRRLKQL
jgi:hypothetical protein